MSFFAFMVLDFEQYRKNGLWDEWILQKRKFGRDMGLSKKKMFQDFPGEKTGYRIEVKTSSCKLGMPPKIYFSEKKLES